LTLLHVLKVFAGGLGAVINVAVKSLGKGGVEAGNNAGQLQVRTGAALGRGRKKPRKKRARRKKETRARKSARTRVRHTTIMRLIKSGKKNGKRKPNCELEFSRAQG
jgi:hypothetical protein